MSLNGEFEELQKEGHDPNEYFFEVSEVSPTKKPMKRANKKLTRDDESETHSNLDESQHDLQIDDDEKIDSEDDGIDEKVLETADADTGEDAINLSIEEEEKLLIEEEEAGLVEKYTQAEKCDGKSGKKRGGATTTRPGSSNNNGTAAKEEEEDEEEEDERESSSPAFENANAAGASTTGGAKRGGAAANELDSSCGSVGEDHAPLSVEARRDLDMEMSSPKRRRSEDVEGEAQLANGGATNKESGNSALMAKNGGSKNSGSGSSEKSQAKNDEDSHASKGGSKTSTTDKATEAKSATKGDKQQQQQQSQEGEKTTAATATTAAGNKAKSGVAARDGKQAADRPKTQRPVASGRNLWVTGLSSTTRATDIKSLFSKYGKVVGAKIVSNARSSGSRCFGFVTMATTDEANKCIQHLHRTELHGRMISVERAKGEPIGATKKVDAKQAVVAKKVVEKREAAVSTTTNQATKEAEVNEKKSDDKVDKKEKVSEAEKKKEESRDKEKVKENDAAQSKESGEKKDEEAHASDTKDSQKSPKKDDEKKSDRKSSHSSPGPKSSSRDRAIRDKLNRERHEYRMRRVPLVFKDRKFIRRPFIKRPMMGGIHPRKNPLTFHRIREERMRQRAREEEREMREVERRRRQEIMRQREIERKQREESIRLERERERLRIERERLERDRAEVLRLEREKQRLERERIEREREELRRRERMRVLSSRMDEPRRPVKRPFESYRGARDTEIDDRKRNNAPAGGSRRIVDTMDRKGDRFAARRDAPVPDRDGRTERGHFERAPLSRDTDLRSHGRDDRSTPYRDGDSSSHTRVPSKDDWKSGSGGDRRSGHAMSGRDRDKFDSSKGLSNDSYVARGDSRFVDRSSDSWHGVSQSEGRGSGSKSYSDGLGSSGPRDSWASDRKGEGQSWGRSDASQSDRWGGGINSGGRGQSLGMSQSMMAQPQSALFGASSSSSGGMLGMGVSGGGSYNSDRFDAYKGMSSMRRF